MNVANNAGPMVTNDVTMSGGGSAAASASDSTTIMNPCDVNQYGTTTVADIQTVINEALGVGSVADDLNQDGVANVVDVQIVINSAMGLGCWGA